MSNLIFIKDNDNNVGIGSNMINDIKGNINITQNLNVTGNVNLTNGEMIKTTGIGSFGSINIKKLAINGDYGSNTQYLKSGGSGSDLTWGTIASSPWTTSGSDIYRSSGNVAVGTTSPSYKLDVRSSDEVVANFQGTGDSFVQVSSNGTTDVCEIGYIIRKHDSPKYWFIGVEDSNDLQFCLGDDETFQKSSEGKMTITTEGYVGVGTTSPSYKLDVRSSDEVVANFQGTGDSFVQVSSNGTTDVCEIGYIIRKHDSPKYWFIGVEDSNDLQFCLGDDETFQKSSEGKMTITTEGYVGIGQFYGAPGSTQPNAGTPYYPLDVRKSRQHHAGSGFAATRFYTHSGILTNPFNIGYAFSAYFQGSLHIASDGVAVTSDSRIKTNIVDVPDNLALEQLRNIPCRYYEYIDKLTRGTAQTIGFIAQEVKTVMPMAVSQTKEIMPDIYKNINCTWTSNADNFNMSSTDLPNVNGVKYRFYVSNATDASDEQEIILTGKSDNTFTFNTQYTNVFCYGKEVDDFHTLFKDKLFTLNFSATQEIDKIQQQHKIEIESLKSEVSTLKTENQEQQTKINELTSIIDKLKTANSFDEFKNSL